MWPGNLDIDQWKGQEAKGTGPNLQLDSRVDGILVLFCQSVLIVLFTQSRNTCYPYDTPRETSYSYYLTQPSQTLYEMERRDPILLIRKQVERGEANCPRLHS